MWINRILFCIWKGHSFVDITTGRKPYQYCLRCGKIKEPASFLKPVPVHVHAHTNH